MKKYILLAFSLFILPVAIFAQTTDYKTVGETWMQKVMGDSYTSFIDDMNQMMGTDYVYRMKEAAGRAYESNKGYIMMPASSENAQGCEWNKNDKEELKKILLDLGNAKASWFGGIIGGAIVGAAIVCGLVALAIPIAILVLLIVLIVKLIKSLNKK